jgi:hypothetical protein
MVCNKTIEVEQFSDDTISLFFATAMKYEWQVSNGEYGCFICCPDCIEIAYDPNGRLGFLKDEWKKKAIKKE